MPNPNISLQRSSSWSNTLIRVLLICAGCIAILLPAWLPNRPSVPIEQGTVEMLQALLLGAAAVVVLGAANYAGKYKPICHVLALGFIAAFVGEIEDFVSGILGWKFPEHWLVAALVLSALVIIIRKRAIMVRFFAELGTHAGSGFIGAALLIAYVFNRIIGSRAFWQATLGDAFSPNIPRICKGYLELLACYLFFIGALGLSITMARRKDPS